jgi:hypothetical protein
VVEIVVAEMDNVQLLLVKELMVFLLTIQLIGVLVALALLGALKVNNGLGDVMCRETLTTDQPEPVDLGHTVVIVS